METYGEVMKEEIAILNDDIKNDYSSPSFFHRRKLEITC